MGVSYRGGKPASRPSPRRSIPKGGISYRGGKPITRVSPIAGVSMSKYQAAVPFMQASFVSAGMPGLMGESLLIFRKAATMPSQLTHSERAFVRQHMPSMKPEYRKKFVEFERKLTQAEMKEKIKKEKKKISVSGIPRLPPGVATGLLYAATPATLKAMWTPKIPTIIKAGERVGIEAVKLQRWSTGEEPASVRAMEAMLPSYKYGIQEHEKKAAAFETKWAPYTEGEYFTGTTAEHREYMGAYEEVRREGAQLERQSMAFGQLETQAEREEKERYWGLEEPYKRRVKKPTSEWVKARTPEIATVTPEMEKDITKTYGTYRRLFGMPAEEFEIEKKMGHAASQYKTGMYEGFREDPLKMVVTTAVFAALPPVLKGAKYVSKAARFAPAAKYVRPVAITLKKGIPKVKRLAAVKVGVEKGILPASARFIPKVAEYGMGATYAGVVGYETYMTPPSERAYKLGRMTTTEFAPMAVGGYAGVKLTTMKSPIYGIRETVPTPTGYAEYKGIVYKGKPVIGRYKYMERAGEKLTEKLVIPERAPTFARQPIIAKRVSPITIQGKIKIRSPIRKSVMSETFTLGTPHKHKFIDHYTFQRPVTGVKIEWRQPELRLQSPYKRIKRIKHEQPYIETVKTPTYEMGERGILLGKGARKGIPMRVDDISITIPTGKYSIWKDIKTTHDMKAAQRAASKRMQSGMDTYYAEHADVIIKTRDPMWLHTTGKYRTVFREMKAKHKIKAAQRVSKKRATKSIEDYYKGRATIDITTKRPLWSLKLGRKVKRKPTPFTKEDVAAVDAYYAERTGGGRAEKVMRAKGEPGPSETIFTSGIAPSEVQMGVMPTPTQGRLLRVDRPVMLPPEMMVSGIPKGRAIRIYGAKPDKIGWDVRMDSGFVGKPPRPELGLTGEQIVSGIPTRRIKVSDPQWRRTMLELKYPEIYGEPPGYVAGREKAIRIGEKGDPTRIRYVEGKGVQFGEIKKTIRTERELVIRERGKDIMRMFKYPEIYGPLPSITGIKRVPMRRDITRIPKEGDPLRIGITKITKGRREYKAKWEKEQKAIEKDIKESKVTAREEGGLITVQKVEVAPPIVKEKAPIKPKETTRSEFEDYMHDYRFKMRERERATETKRTEKIPKKDRRRYGLLPITVVSTPLGYKPREKIKKKERRRVGISFTPTEDQRRFERIVPIEDAKEREREKERERAIPREGIGFQPIEAIKIKEPYKPIEEYKPIEVIKPIEILIPRLKEPPPPPPPPPPPEMPPPPPPIIGFGWELPKAKPRKKLRTKRKQYAWEVKNPIPELQEMFSKEMHKRRFV